MPLPLVMLPTPTSSQQLHCLAHHILPPLSQLALRLQDLWSASFSPRLPFFSSADDVHVLFLLRRAITLPPITRHYIPWFRALRILTERIFFEDYSSMNTRTALIESTLLIYLLQRSQDPFHLILRSSHHCVVILFLQLYPSIVQVEAQAVSPLRAP